MVTLTKYGAKYNRNILFLEGLSTDTKPTGEFDGLSIQNGSEYTEVDTGKKFLFDYDNATWYEVQTGGGGGGGGGTSNYNDLSNRPSVNNTVLTGNKTSAQLGLASSEQGGKADSAIQGVKLNSGSAITPDANNIVDITVGKSDVGLDNVTNDAQVKKISSSTSGDIVTWSGTSGDTVADSGVSIETSITDSNLKIPTSKAVNTALSGKQATIDSSHKLSADLVDNSTPTFATATQGGKADTAVQTIKVNSASTGVTKTGDTVDITAIPASIVSAGALVNGMTATTQTTSDDSAKVATTAFVHDVVDSLPSPMVFKGSLGTGGTITTLPTASSSNKGYVYKVITAGTYASQSAKVGDTFISDGSVWVLIPSGDEPSGTVTNVAVANGGGLTVSGSPITSSGTITVGHSNSVTAKTSSSVKKFTYDAYGHVTGSSELSTAESNALASGIDSTKVGQISTNQTNIGKVQTQANWNTNNGVKNLLKINASSGTSGDVTYVVNSDGTISCTAIGGTGLSILSIGKFTFKANTTYTLTGCPSGGDDGKYEITNKGQDPSFGIIRDNGNGTTFTTGSTDEEIELMIYFRSNHPAASNLVFKPMLTYAFVTDTTFEPYSLPNTKITPELIELVDSGAKNLLDLSKVKTLNPTGWTGNKLSLNGVDWTFNSDGSITVNGTANSTGSYPKFMSDKTLPIGTYMMSGGSSTAIFTAFHIGSDTGSGYQLDVTSSTTQPIDFIGNVAANTQVNNVTIRPMLCTKSAWDVSQKYVPYRPSYEETVEQVATNKNNISSLVDSGAKNKLNLYGLSPTIPTGLTMTQNGNKYVVSGTVSATSVISFANIPKIDGTLVLSGCPAGGSPTGYSMDIKNVVNDTGSGSEPFTLTGAFELRFRFAAGTYENVEFMPMICSEHDWEISHDFAPYAMTNAEITAWILSHS